MGIRVSGEAVLLLMKWGRTKKVLSDWQKYPAILAILCPKFPVRFKEVFNLANALFAKMNIGLYDQK